jgi:ribokinase
VPEITVVGSLNLDTTVRVPRLPAPGETILGTDRFDDTGGKGANQAVAAARLGRSVAMVGMVGSDDAGNRLRSALAADGVDTRFVAVSQQTATGMAIIQVDESGENTIVVDPAANGAFRPEHLASVAHVVAAASVVLIQLEIPLDTVAAAVAAATGIVILNPAPATSLPIEVLRGVHVLVPNASELALLAGSDVPANPDEAIAAARTLDGPESVVVTLGAQGAVVVTGGSAHHIPAPTITAVDPTAAGDAFCGGLADALVRGEGLVEAVRWAVRCGAVAATRWGAQASLPTRAEVLAMEEGE